MASSNGGGGFSIVSCRHTSQWEMAAKVSAMLVNKTAWVWATGATWAEALPIWRKNWLSSVLGSARLVMTGVSDLKKGLSAWMAVLREAPLPAKASPKPAVASRMFG